MALRSFVPAYWKHKGFVLVSMNQLVTPQPHHIPPPPTHTHILQYLSQEPNSLHSVLILFVQHKLAVVPTTTRPAATWTFREDKIIFMITSQLSNSVWGERECFRSTVSFPGHLGMRLLLVKEANLYWCLLLCSSCFLCLQATIVVLHIGVGTRGAGGARAPPIFYPRDFINIHTCSADRHVAVYITFSPPKWKCFLRLCCRQSGVKVTNIVHMPFFSPLYVTWIILPSSPAPSTVLLSRAGKCSLMALCTSVRWSLSPLAWINTHTHHIITSSQNILGSV